MRIHVLIALGLLSVPAACDKRAANGNGELAAPATCHMTTEDGDKLLVEYWRDRRPAPPDGLRVTVDGQVFERVVRPRAPEDAPPLIEVRWEAVGALDAAALARLQALLADRFAALSPSYRVDGALIDAPNETWTACVDGRKKIVKVEGGRLVEAPAVDAFRAAFLELLRPPPPGTGEEGVR